MRDTEAIDWRAKSSKESRSLGDSRRLSISDPYGISAYNFLHVASLSNAIPDGLPPPSALDPGPCTPPKKAPGRFSFASTTENEDAGHPDEPDCNVATGNACRIVRQNSNHHRL